MTYGRKLRRVRVLIALGIGLGILLICAATGRAELRVSSTMVGVNSLAPYSYGRVEVRNQYGREMTYRLVIRDYMANQQTTFRDQRLGAGQTRVYHVPLLRSEWPNWQVWTRDEVGQEAYSGLSGEAIHYLHVSSLQERVSSVDLEQFAKLYPPDGAASTYYPSSYSSGSTDYVSQVEVTDLPDNWLCYCPFKVVFMQEQAWQLVAPAKRKALQQWVQVGGRLVVYGNSEKERTERSMLGTIHYVSSNPIKHPTLDERWRSSTAGWLSLSRGAPVAEESPYAIRQWTGSIGGVALATLFFLVAGPMNYWYFARRNRIRALLVSLPVASIACCLLITGYFLISQGFARRGGSLAVIVLDEETDSAVTFSRHVFFSGLYPLGGFSFPRNAAFIPMERHNRREGFTLDLTENQLLRAGFFSPSTNFHYFTVAPWTTRAKLVWDLDQMTVVNGFDADAAWVLLCVDQKIYEARRVPKGGESPLREVAASSEARAILVQKDLNGGTAADSYLLRQMGEFLDPFSHDTSTPQYVVVFEVPPVDLNAGLAIGGENKRCVLVGRSLLRGESSQ